MRVSFAKRGAHHIPRVARRLLGGERVTFNAGGLVPEVADDACPNDKQRLCLTAPGDGPASTETSFT